MTNTLSDLRPGESGIITDMHLTGLMKRRLIDLGVTTGARVTMLRTAPLGDPVEYNILGYNLSLRKNEAKKIFIETVGEENG
ncbi:MAG: ferrous iron transport protein A [Oscillospiraceae bacterium]|nr:ferrous iron transport protein A [Oscillospiraceae bacterium]